MDVKLLKWTLLGLMLGLARHAGAATAPVGYDVFLVPGPGIRPIMASLGRQLSAHGLTSLYAKGFLPHVTLYLTDYPAERLSEIEARVRAIASGERPFYMRLGHLTATPSHWLLLGVDVSPRMQHLADAITRTLEPLRAPNQPMPGWVKAYPKKQVMFRRYGSPNVFAQFQPHLTVLTPSSPSRLDAFMRNPDKTFTGRRVKIVGIGIAEVDAHGQARRVVAHIPFAP